jgi:hypothetical protein
MVLASYGFTLSWLDKIKPLTGARVVAAQVDLDLAKFTRMFVDLMTAPARVPARPR